MLKNNELLILANFNFGTISHLVFNRYFCLILHAKHETLRYQETSHNLKEMKKLSFTK